MTPDNQSCRPDTCAEGEPLFPSLPVELGGYTLTQLLGSHAECDVYIARQSHVERRVVLEILRHPAGSPEAELFLATARARGATREANVAAVLESANTPEGYTYLCQEAPNGTPLSALAAEGKLLTPQQICTLISTAGKLYTTCAQAGTAAAPLTADRVFMDRSGAFTFLSPVLAAPAAADEPTRQQQALAAAIRPLQPHNVPGQGRIATLLSWMQEGYEGESLDWPAIIQTAELIAEQLRPESLLHIDRPQHYDRGREQRAGKRRRRQRRRNNVLIAAAVLTILAMGAGGILLAPGSVPPIPALRGDAVHCREGDKHVRVAARPVSVDEYRRFLEAFPGLDAARRGSLTQGIPPAESDPTPGEWEAQLAGNAPSAPVTRVSYWQALMYARYHRATLPTAALLSAARREDGQPVPEEWTRDESPATPPYAKARIVLPAGEQASPIPESNAAAQSPQRGFRLCR